MAPTEAGRTAAPPRALSAPALLRAARDRLEDPAAWTRGDGRSALAVTRSGERVPAGDPRACQWCVLSALQRAAWSHHPRDLVRVRAYDGLIGALRAVEAEAGAPLREVGSRLTHADVLELLDRAAQRAERTRKATVPFEVERAVEDDAEAALIAR